MIRALAPDAPHEPLTHGVRPWGFIRGVDDLQPTGLGRRLKEEPKLWVVVADQVFGGLPKRRGLAQLLRDPFIGRMRGGVDPRQCRGLTCTTRREPMCTITKA